MSKRSEQCIEPYRANIRVVFDTRDVPFHGTVYNQGDGNHVLFQWPDQPNTAESMELAEFASQTKWVTKGGISEAKPFEYPDPNFSGMVSHQGYEPVASMVRQHVYESSEGVRCTYTLDHENREVIASIEFKGTRIDFENVQIGAQAPSRFVKPC